MAEEAAAAEVAIAEPAPAPATATATATKTDDSIDLPKKKVDFDTTVTSTSTRTSRVTRLDDKTSADSSKRKSALADSKKSSGRTGRLHYTKPGTVDYRHSATLPKGMTKYSVLLEPSVTPRSSSTKRYQRSNSYTYVPRNFNPRKVRDYDENDDDSPPLDLDFDEQLYRPRPSSIVFLKLDEIERQVMELDPFENSDMKKGLKQVKYHSKLALDSHDQAMRRSRRLDKQLLDSFYDKMDEINDDLTSKHNACVQSFQRLTKACNRISFDRGTPANTNSNSTQVRHSRVLQEPQEPVDFEPRRMRESLESKMREYRGLIGQPRSSASGASSLEGRFEELSLDKQPARRSYYYQLEESDRAGMDATLPYRRSQTLRI